MVAGVVIDVGREPECAHSYEGVFIVDEFGGRYLKSGQPSWIQLVYAQKGKDLNLLVLLK